MDCVQLIPPDKVCERLAGDVPARLIDVRGLDEFSTVHVEGAQCAPLPRLLEAASSWSPEEELLLICHSGVRAGEAARKLAEAGFQRLAVVEGGTQACAKAGVPVVRGKKRIPIQRQVIIVAGLLVLAGLMLSYVQPAFIALSWVVSAGLVFAGATGICPMTSVVAAAPWNKDVSADSSCGAAGGCS